MFFLSDEERQTLIRGLLPRSREQFINPELRGWNWHQPPLQPSHEVPMPLFLVAGRYCDSGRDVYLQKVRKLSPEPTRAMREGAVLHDVVRQVFTLAKKLIYTLGPERIQEFEAQMSFDNCRLSSQEFADKAKTLWNFELRRFSYRLEEIMAKQPYIQEDALAYLTLPVVLEQKVDGSFLGLSPNLSCDAMVFGEPMIMEIKFGPPLPFYRYYTTGYAMVSEALYGHPVNLGCLVYPRFSKDGTRVSIKRDLHLITDELRIQFIEQRDEMSRIVALELDPGLPATCYANCHLWNCCHGGQEAPQPHNQKALERIRGLRSTKTDEISSIGASALPAQSNETPP